MKLSKSSAASAYQPGCLSHRMVKGWRSNRGYMFAMMLAMLALMAVMGVGLSRLMMTTKATTQMQRTQDNKQLMSSLVMTLSSKAADSDGDFVLEPPAMQSFNPATPTVGGLLPEDVANVDAWGRRLGYCAYDYGTQPTAAATGRIRGSATTPPNENPTNSSPTDSWVALVVISAGPDGVFNKLDASGTVTVMTPSNRPYCPPVLDDSVTPNKVTAASGVAATGDDMVAARSYGEMISFGNAQIASKLSGLGSNTTNKLCRLGSDGKMICDISTGISNSNTAYRMCRSNEAGSIVCDIPSWLPGVPGYNTMPPNSICRTDGSGYFRCDTYVATCGAGQVSKWNGSSFECVGAGSLSIYRAEGGISCGGVYRPEPDSGAHVYCADGYMVTGGGYMMTDYSTRGGTNSPEVSYPCGDNCWQVRAGGVSGGCFQVWAVCVKTN